MTPIIEHLFGDLTSRSLKPVPFPSRNCSTAAKECWVKAYITTEIVSKTLNYDRISHGIDNKLTETY